MPPASNQLFSFNDVASEVSAGRMLWSGSAMSGNSPISFSQFTAYVMNDGSNPNSYASNQCLPYSEGLARAVVIPPPYSLTITPGSPTKCTCNWLLPTDAGRTGVEITFYASTSYPTGLTTLLAYNATSYTKTGLSSGETVSYTLRAKHGVSTFGNYVYSPSGTIP